MTVYKVLYVLTYVIQIIFVPLFLKAAWPKRCTKSLIFKMICATTFICAALLSIKISGNNTFYAKLILAALAFSWLGDLLLHINDEAIMFLLGAMSFLVGHIFYVSAYFHVQNRLFEDLPFLSVWEIVAIIALLTVAGIVLLGILKLKMGFMLIPLSIYGTMLVTMFVKATSLGIHIINSGLTNATVLGAIFISGSLLFVVSDATLAVLSFDDERKTFKLKCVNIVTYFAAQMLLGSTILFIA